jgi:hypothetical protein
MNGPRFGMVLWAAGAGLWFDMAWSSGAFLGRFCMSMAVVCTFEAALAMFRYLRGEK